MPGVRCGRQQRTDVESSCLAHEPRTQQSTDRLRDPLVYSDTDPCCNHCNSNNNNEHQSNGKMRNRFLRFGRFWRCHLATDSDKKRYLQRYKQKFTNHKMILQTYSNLNVMMFKKIYEQAAKEINKSLSLLSK